VDFVYHKQKYRFSRVILVERGKKINLILLFKNLELNQRTHFDCCQNLSQKNYCFLFHSKQYPDQNGACMEARVVTKHPSCYLNSDCQSYHAESSCVHPFSSDNITRLIRLAHTNGPPILFVGSIHEIYRTSKKLKIISGLFFFALSQVIKKRKNRIILMSSNK